MAIDFKKEQIKLENIIGENSERETVIEAIKLAHNELVIDKVLDFDCRISTLEYQIESEGVKVNASIKLEILYNAIDYEDKESIEYFSSEFDLENFIIISELKSQPELKAIVELKLIEQSYELLNDNEINVEFSVNQFVRVYNYQQFEIIKQVSGLKERLLEKEQVKLEDIISDDKINSSLKEEFKLNEELDKVIATRYYFTELEEKIKNNTIMLAGKLVCEIIYSKDEMLRSKRKEFGFTEKLCNLLEMDDLNIEFNLVYNELSHKFDKEQQKIELEVEYEIMYRVSRLREFDIISNVKSEKVELEEEKIKIEEIIGKESFAKSIRKNLVLPELKPDIKNIITERIKVLPAVNNVKDGGVLVKRDLLGKIIYTTAETEGLAYDFSNEFEVSNFISIPNTREGMNSYTEVKNENIKAEILNARTVELKFDLKKRVIVKEFKVLNLVTDIIEVAPIVYQKDSKQASYVVYIVKKGDDLEKIAKRYKTTADHIIAENEDLSLQELVTGTKLLLPKEIINL